MLFLLNQQVDTTLVCQWVAEAGYIARHYFGRADVEWKGIGDPVTTADRQIERLITTRIHEAYPTHGILGEEYGSEMLDREYVWTIDPIDGTRAFVDGLPSWCITLALLHDRVPEFGLVYMPLYDDWTYTDGDDVICNGVSIRDQLPSTWGEDSCLFGRSDMAVEFDVSFNRVMALGSSASHIAYTARGAGVATVAHGAYVWDIAGGAAILNKQGGELRFLSGEVVDFSQIDLTQPMNEAFVAAHPEVVRRLIPLITPRDCSRNHPIWR
jgi:myo-inositol-1(or 4)-monophosphatase